MLKSRSNRKATEARFPPLTLHKQIAVLQPAFQLLTNRALLVLKEFQLVVQCNSECWVPLSCAVHVWSYLFP